MAASKAPAKDAHYRSAYLAGAGGRPLPPGLGARADEDPALDHMHDAGRNGATYAEALRRHAPHAAPEPASPRNPSTGPPPRTRAPKPLRRWLRGGPIELGAGVILGGVVYALGVSLVRYGAKGPSAWLSAKFLNKTSGVAAQKTSTKKPTSAVPR